MDQKKRRIPNQKEQLRRITIGIVKLQESMLTEEKVRFIVRDEIRGVKEDMREVRAELATKPSRKEIDLKIESESKALADHMHTLLKQHGDSHSDIRKTLDNHESRLIVVESKP